MSGSVIKFGFEVLAETRDEAVQMMDDLGNQIILEQGGEPWVVTRDELAKRATSVEALFAGLPGSSFYVGGREYVFAGPTKLGPEVDFRDGFRPQAQNESGPAF